MPLNKPQLRKFNPPGKKANPLTYFKGSRTDLFKVSSKEIVQAFANAGIKNFASSDALKFKRKIFFNSMKNKSQSLIELILPENRTVFFKLAKTKTGRILVKQHSVVHGITGKNPFNDLMKILSMGFKGKASFGAAGNLLSNAELRLDRNSKSSFGRKIIQEGLLKGDSYSVELTPSVVVKKPFKAMDIFVDKASPDSISRININISSKASKKEAERKKVFYRSRLLRFGIPIKFIIN